MVTNETNILASEISTVDDVNAQITTTEDSLTDDIIADSVNAFVKTKPSKQERLRTEKISGLVLSYTLTTLMALVMNSFYNIADTMFVSWGVGDIAMGGVSVIYPFVLIQTAIATAFGSGAASIVSRKLGASERQQAGKTTRNAMIAFYTVALAITAVGFLFMEQFLKLFGATGVQHEYAKTYFTIILISNVFSNTFAGIMRAEGSSIYAMLVWIIPVGLNIMLDAIFILACGMGVLGAGLATAIGQAVGFCMCIYYFWRRSSQDFKDAKFSIKTIGEVVSVGLPSLIQLAGMAVMLMLTNNILGKLSNETVISAFGYASKIIVFAVMPFIAVAQAIGPIMGYNYGAKAHKRVKQTFNFGMLYSLAFAVVAVLIVFFLSDFFISIFTNNAEIISLGGNALRITSFALIFYPIFSVIGASYQAMGKRIISNIIFGSIVFFAIPSMFILSYAIGIDTIWYAYIISFAGCALVSILIYAKARLK